MQTICAAIVGTGFMGPAHVEVVCADLKTVHPIHQRPVGEVETFKGKVEQMAATTTIPTETEDCGAILLRLQGGVGVVCGYRR